MTNQRTQYYPSGLPWSEALSPSTQPYKYNGKEFVEMHGYDTYDYGARGLHAAKMRFDTMDPLAEKYPEISPYAYCGNNPVNRIDPTGMDWYTDYDGTYHYSGLEDFINRNKYSVKENLPITDKFEYIASWSYVILKDTSYLIENINPEIPFTNMRQMPNINFNAPE
ncbi:MAG: hypothetical protein LBH19_06435 [Dysgonamonadaceae bacterium]|nr:hypothetical protein [Dysgonamonadaceae bacterium]